jgi:hypothetical protein
MRDRHPGLLWYSASAVAIAMASTVHAGWASVVVNGAETSIRSVNMPNLLSDPGTVFSNADVDALHDSLNNGGVDTLGYLTMVLAETARGTSLVLLADGPGTPITVPNESLLGIEAIWDGTDTSLINLADGGSWTVTDIGDGTQVGAGAMQWLHEWSYEALTITELSQGQSVLMNMYDLGMVDMYEQVLQLVSFTQSGEWSVLSTYSFNDESTITANTTILAVPGPMTIALLAMAGLRRRRR